MQIDCSSKALLPNFRRRTRREDHYSKKLGCAHALFHIKTEWDVVANTYALLQPSKLNLSEMIPGFGHGVLGMKVGEKRKLFIHPNVGYGMRANFDGGVYFVAEVELLDVENSTESLPPLIEEECPKDIAEMTEEDYRRVQKLHYHDIGYVN